MAILLPREGGGEELCQEAHIFENTHTSVHPPELMKDITGVQLQLDFSKMGKKLWATDHDYDDQPQLTEGGC